MFMSGKFLVHLFNFTINLFDYLRICDKILVICELNFILGCPEVQFVYIRDNKS